MTKEDTRKLLFTIAAAFPNFKVNNPDVAVAIWFDLLKEQDANLIYAAFRSFVAADKTGFAPSVGQLINKAYDLTHQDDTTASEAWARVYKAIRNGAYNAAEEFNKLPPDIQKAVGSAAQIHAWAIDENFNENVISSNFMRAYAQVKARERNDAMIPADVKARLDGMTSKMIEGGTA